MQKVTEPTVTKSMSFIIAVVILAGLLLATMIPQDVYATKGYRIEKVKDPGKNRIEYFGYSDPFGEGILSFDIIVAKAYYYKILIDHKKNYKFSKKQLKKLKKAGKKYVEKKTHALEYKITIKKWVYKNGKGKWKKVKTYKGENNEFVYDHHNGDGPWVDELVVTRPYNSINYTVKLQRGCTYKATLWTNFPSIADKEIYFVYNP